MKGLKPTMHLRFHPTLHTEPFRPSVVRLLFEGKVPSEPESDIAGQDFYLYVWVKDHAAVIGFQAVLDESIIAVYRAPDYLTFGRISRFPMNRAVDGCEIRFERDLMQAAMHGMENSAFSVLVSEVECVAVGGKRVPIALNADETAYLATLPIE
jgi:hypothetical protein